MLNLYSFCLKHWSYGHIITSSINARLVHRRQLELAKARQLTRHEAGGHTNSDPGVGGAFDI